MMIIDNHDEYFLLINKYPQVLSDFNRIVKIARTVKKTLLFY